MKKRLLAVQLCVLLILALFPVTAFATSTIRFITEPNPNTFVTAGKISGSLSANAIVTPSDTVTLNWYACSESGVISGNSLGTGESFTIPTNLNVDVYFYRCQATYKGAEPVNSRVAAVLVGPDVTFTTQPAQSTNVTAGSINKTLTVETNVYPTNTTGVELNWYETDGDGTFTYGGAKGKGKTFAIPNMLAPGTYYYLCQATIGTNLTVNSSVAEVKVEEASGTTSTIEFTTHPESGMIYVTEGVISEVLTAKATVSPSGTPTLNWYRCTGWTGFVTGEPSLCTGETFPIPSDLLDVGKDYYYICQATYPGAAPVNSKVATIRVGKASETSPVVGFTTHPVPSTTVMEGSSPGSLTAEAKVIPLSSGLTPTLRWYECGEDGFVSGPLLSTSTTLAIPAGLSKGTYYYRCQAYCAEASPTVTSSRIAKVTVLGSDAETVTTPTFSPDGGTYTSVQNVTISCETSDATIHYTNDGSEPTENSKTYYGAISMNNDTTLKAKAFKEGMMSSETASETYNISVAPPAETVATPTFDPAGGTYASAQNVKLSCATPDAKIYYTTDGSNPSESSTLYVSGTPISVSNTTTIKAKAFRNDMTASSVASTTYSITQPETKYSVSVLPSANGIVIADKATAKKNDTVTLTVTPDDGYKLKKIQILDGLGQDLCAEIGLNITNNSFQMPNMNVKIQAIFEKIIADGTVDELAELDGKIHFNTSIPDDCILDIREIKPIPSSYKVKTGEVAMLFDITVLRNNLLYPITNNKMTVTLTLPENLVGYDYYRVSYFNSDNKLVETQTAVVNRNQLQFTTNHLSNYMVEAGNNPKHTHSYSSVWESDKTNHWHECTCGEKADTASHDYGEWAITKDATTTGNGSKERTCSVCGYKEKAIIAATGTSVQTGDTYNITLWLAFLFISGGIIMTLGVPNRKRREQ